VSERATAALRRAAWSVPAVLLAATTLWVLVGRVLAVDRGLDLTDEGLYLLEADPPTPSAAWLLPYGWHTAPLFRLVGHDVAAFRTAGAVLLVGAAGLLGWAAVRAGHRLRGGRPGCGRDPADPDLTLTVPAIVAGMLGGLLYYAGMVRTPSYNWLTVLGTVIAATGVLGLVSSDPGNAIGEDAEPRRGWRRHAPPGAAWLVLVGFGLLLTVPAKPTTPVLFAALVAPVLAVRSGVGTALRQLVTIAVSSALLLGLAVLAGVWSTAWPEIFRRALAAPALSDTHGLGGAVRAMVLLPVRAVEASPLVLAVVGGGLVTLLLRRAHPQPPALARGVLVLGLVVVAWLAADLPTGVLLGGQGEIRFGRAGSTTALLALVVAVAAVGRGPGGRDGDGHGDEARDGSAPAWVRGLTLLLLLALPFVTAFGSDNLPYGQAALAGVLFVAGALFVLGTTADVSARRVGAATLVGALAVIAAVIGVDNLHHPYRTPPIADQDVPVAVGHRGAELRLDPERATLLRSLRDTAEADGWRPGTRLFGLAPWSSTIPWHLGARVPDSIMPTLRGSEERLAFNLAWLDLEGWEAAWLLVTSADSARPGDLEDSLANVETFTDAVGTTFPDDYQLVWRAPAGSPRFADVELWRPTG
jgi:hypothetical protein